MQKRMLKKMGYHRDNEVEVEVAGLVMKRKLRRGQGPIVNGNGDPVGIGLGQKHWPLSRPTLSE